VAYWGVAGCWAGLSKVAGHQGQIAVYNSFFRILFLLFFYTPNDFMFCLWVEICPSFAPNTQPYLVQRYSGRSQVACACTYAPWLCQITLCQIGASYQIDLILEIRLLHHLAQQRIVLCHHPHTALFCGCAISNSAVPNTSEHYSSVCG
jgi:hypothetical protein